VRRRTTLHSLSYPPTLPRTRQKGSTQARTICRSGVYVVMTTTSTTRWLVIAVTVASRVVRRSPFVVRHRLPTGDGCCGLNVAPNYERTNERRTTNDERTNKRTNEQTNERTNERTIDCANERTIERLIARTNEHPFSSHYSSGRLRRSSFVDRRFSLFMLPHTVS